MPLYIVTFFVWLTFLVLASFRWGGWPERSVIWMLAVGVTITLIVRSGHTTKYRDVELGVALIDLAFLAGVGVVALRSERWWPLCAAAIQTVTVTGHLAKLMVPNLSRLAYALMIGLPAYPLVAVLTVALVNAGRRGGGRSAAD